MRTLTVIATGHSVSWEQVQYVKEAVTDVMVINETYMIAPWADYLYAADGDWWRAYALDVEKRFRGKCYSVDVPNKYTGRGEPIYVKGHNPEAGGGGLSKNKGTVINGGSSGHAGLNLAYHFGYERVILLGFDFHGGHWFQEEFRPKLLQKGTTNLPPSCKALKDCALALEEAGVEVVNCTPNSKFDWPYTPLEKAL